MIPSLQPPPIFEKLRTLLPWPRSHHMIGLDLGARAISFVELHPQHGLDHVWRWGSEPLEPQIIEQGRIINRSALVEALKANTIKGAAIDVFEDEPALAPGLAECENAVITKFYKLFTTNGIKKNRTVETKCY